MRIGAYIFDMDDLLVRSGGIWRAAEERLLAALGRGWSEEIALRCKGMNALDVAGTIHRIVEASMPLAECQRMMRDGVIEGFGGEILPMPGAVELVRRLSGSRPLAVASGSPLVAIERAMDQLGIRGCFDRFIITSESVPRGKPHPDVFLAAAKALEVPPSECLVFEDSLIGVRAARAAGMSCFAVPSTSHLEISGLATRCFASLGEIDDRALVEENGYLSAPHAREKSGLLPSSR